MTLEIIRSVFGWCTIMNGAVMAVWALSFMCAHERIHRMHGKFFSLSKENFDAMHYAGIGIFKMVVIVFNLVPYLALRIVG